MMARKKQTEKEDKIGRWSIEKLDLLRKYIEAYGTILRKQSWCKSYEYIDCFAGAGKAKTKDEQSFVDGSPRIALGLQHPFTQYHFIEQSDWRAKQLESLRTEFKDRHITIYHGDSNKVIVGQILPQMTYQSFKRAIAFVDPYGMEMEWDSMKALAEARTIDVLLNFPVMAINRGVLRKRPEAISPEAKVRMDRFWGTKDWEADIYEEELGLWGPERIKIKQHGIELGHKFKKRLEEVFPHCTAPVLMTNSNNAPLYCIMFAGHNQTGAKIATDIFERHLQLRMG